MKGCISKALSADSGMPQMILHSRSCLASPITTNNKDGSLNFHLHSDQTEAFKDEFGSIKTDLRFWMMTFDELKNKNLDDRGFSEKIDLGWARHGSSESASVSQNCSDQIVCALPNVINRDKVEEFEKIAWLPDQMTDFMDRHFLDNGCKLFDDTLRDKQFAGSLRSKHKGKKFRAEAFAIVRQKLGSAEDTKKGKCDFQPTERHT